MHIGPWHSWHRCIKTYLNKNVAIITETVSVLIGRHGVQLSRQLGTHMDASTQCASTGARPDSPFVFTNPPFVFVTPWSSMMKMDDILPRPFRLVFLSVFRAQRGRVGLILRKPLCEAEMFQKEVLFFSPLQIFPHFACRPQQPPAIMKHTHEYTHKHLCLIWCSSWSSTSSFFGGQIRWMNEWANKNLVSFTN